MIVLDTNVISELMRPSTAERVAAWYRATTDSVTTAVTIAEALSGIERLPAGRRRNDLAASFGKVLATFGRQALAFDADAAGRYAQIVASRLAGGEPIAIFDAQIAAICRTRNATLATRNTRHFENTGVVLVNPWEEG